MPAVRPALDLRRALLSAVLAIAMIFAVGTAVADAAPKKSSAKTTKKAKSKKKALKFPVRLESHSSVAGIKVTVTVLPSQAKLPSNTLVQLEYRRGTRWIALKRLPLTKRKAVLNWTDPVPLVEYTLRVTLKSNKKVIQSTKTLTTRRPKRPYSDTVTLPTPTPVPAPTAAPVPAPAPAPTAEPTPV
ncbi:MAG: hypothetical protein Q7T55_23590, partial [Solirubrobacteraceae bacterium]|nr:hypothetical protein [Solirubrobacteraceae bacterium]